VADYHSYHPILKPLCEWRAPRTILEWGSGESTLLLAGLCPQAQILSIEHDRSWHGCTWSQTRSLPHVEVVHVPHMLSYGGSAGYVTYPLRRLLLTKRSLSNYNLILVDGRSRCDCLVVASLLLTRPGIVVLHDAHRKNYHEGLRAFSSWFLLPDIDIAIASHDELVLPESLTGYGRAVRHEGVATRKPA
jgi:predicted O-methyltransferase YrrM